MARCARLVKRFASLTRQVLRERLHAAEAESFASEVTSARLAPLGFCTAVKCLCVLPCWGTALWIRVQAAILKLRAGFQT
eukprot:971844-Alexandrium_andersonii.AAC.1